MKFNDLLIAEGINPKGVLVLRHTPSEDSLRNVLGWLAAEKPNVYNAYQRAQRPKVERAITKSEYIASFIGREAKTALFVGLYKVGKWKSISRKEFWRIPENIELRRFGMTGMGRERSTTLWFDLRLTDVYANWKGKLIVNWSGLERSWWRWAARNDFSVNAVLQESSFEKAMPDWTEIVWQYDQLNALPRSWKERMTQWRGVYFIFDKASRKGYVGSAYGTENIIGRWRNYSRTGHGGNKYLRQCNPTNLIFSILEIDSHVRAADEIIEKEASWKERLHTRYPNGLNAN